MDFPAVFTSDMNSSLSVQTHGDKQADFRQAADGPPQAPFSRVAGFVATPADDIPAVSGYLASF